MSSSTETIKKEEKNLQYNFKKQLPKKFARLCRQGKDKLKVIFQDL